MANKWVVQQRGGEESLGKDDPAEITVAMEDCLLINDAPAGRKVPIGEVEKAEEEVSVSYKHKHSNVINNWVSILCKFSQNLLECGTK